MLLEFTTPISKYSQNVSMYQFVAPTIYNGTQRFSIVIAPGYSIKLERGRERERVMAPPEPSVILSPIHHRILSLHKKFRPSAVTLYWRINPGWPKLPVSGVGPGFHLNIFRHQGNMSFHYFVNYVSLNSSSHLMTGTKNCLYKMQRLKNMFIIKLLFEVN